MLFFSIFLIVFKICCLNLKDGPKVIGLIHLPWIVITDREGPVRMIKISHYPNHSYDKQYLMNLVQFGSKYKLMFNTGRFLCAGKRNKIVNSCKNIQDPDILWEIEPGYDNLFALKRNGKCLKKLPRYRDGYYSGYILKIGKCKWPNDYRWLIKDIAAKGKNYPPDNDDKLDDEYDDDLSPEDSLNEDSNHTDDLEGVKEPRDPKEYIYKPFPLHALLNDVKYRQNIRIPQPTPTGSNYAVCNLDNYACGIFARSPS